MQWLTDNGYPLSRSAYDWMKDDGLNNPALAEWLRKNKPPKYPIRPLHGRADDEYFHPNDDDHNLYGDDDDDD